MNTLGYRGLKVFQRAHELVLKVYKASALFPRSELFGLTSQIRRCAVSVPANIVEGYGRGTNRGQLQFYHIAKGSLNELEYYIDLSQELGYCNQDHYRLLQEQRNEVGRLLHGYMKSIRI